MIRIESAGKSFDGVSWAVRGVSLDVPDGKTLVLLGSSGSGKTTLLRLINRLLEPTEGRIEVDGVDVASADRVQLRRSIGYVFQRVGLFPHLSVEENIWMPLRLLGRPFEERRARSRELLELVELEPAVFARRYPEELSGGQQQRVGVARALASEPKYLLMDEPFGALDPVTRESLQLALKKLRSRLGKTIVFVTHDIFEALDLGDRIAVLHEGRLEQVGSGAELLKNPATPFVERLFRRPAELLRAEQSGG